MRSAQFKLHADIEDRHWWFSARRGIVKELLRRVVPPFKETWVVDVGCGTGANVTSLAEDYTCIGVDSSEEAIHLAQERFPRVRFICGSVEASLRQIEKDPSAFLLMDVLEHVPDDFRFLSGLLASAKPGTHVLVTVPAHPDLWSGHDVSFGHYRRYDLKRFTSLWEGLPVTARLVSFCNSRLYPLVRAIRHLNRWRGVTSGEAGTDFRMPHPMVNRFLRALFTSDTKALVDLLEGRRTQGVSYGVSLVAVLRREAGDLIPRGRPPGCPPDLHIPGGSDAF